MPKGNWWGSSRESVVILSEINYNLGWILLRRELFQGGSDETQASNLLEVRIPMAFFWCGRKLGDSCGGNRDRRQR